jgi:hypothetical protein
MRKRLGLFFLLVGGFPFADLVLTLPGIQRPAHPGPEVSRSRCAGRLLVMRARVFSVMSVL